MPANGASPSRAEALAAAIEGARAALEQHLRDDPQDTAADETPMDRDALVPERPVLRAYRELIAAGELLKSRRPLRPARRTIVRDADEPQIAITDRPDDLTRIRGVDATFAERLGSIGIRSFAQIAAWEPDDVPTIAHALDLGRDFIRHDVIEQAKMLLVARTAYRQAPTSPIHRNHGSVATWLPRDCEHFAHGGIPSPALSADDIDALRRELRRGVGRNYLRSLADIAPALAMAVAVPADHFDPFESEAEWQPIPLIALPTANVGDDEPSSLWDRPDGHAPASSPPEKKTAVDIVQAADAPPSPLHVAAVARLDELEAEIDTLGAEPVTVPAAKIEAAKIERERVAKPDTPLPALREPNDPTPVAADVGLREAAVPVVDADEADVTITVHRAKPSAVAAMPDLPLRPKRLIARDEPPVAKPVPNTEVSEAAVVIVKRRAAERAAPDLEFYKVPGNIGEPGPVRRLLRAVKVL